MHVFPGIQCLCIIRHLKNANSAFMEEPSAFFLLVFVFLITQQLYSPVISLQ